MARTLIIDHVQKSAAEGVVYIADVRGVGVATARTRAFAAATLVPGTDDDYLVVLEDEPA
jgi:hypothetical protein